MPVTITPVLSREDMEDFLALPFTIYANDPYWVPPVLPHLRKLLDPKTGPFFEVGQAQYFLAKNNGKTVGRISAHLNFAYEKHHDANTGFFGFFECVDDQETADALFQAAGDWVKARGKTRIHGPLSFGIYDEVGLLVEGLNERPVMLHSYNPAYYEKLVVDGGFQKSFNWYAYAFTATDKPLEYYQQQLNKILDEQNVVIQFGNPKEFVKRGVEVREMFNELWKKNWGHVPLTAAQFDDVFLQLRPILRPELINLIIENDELLAFNIMCPDINITLHKTGGNLNLLNSLRLIFDCRIRPLQGVRGIIMAVKKSHQWRRLHYALVLQMFVTILQKHKHIQYVDCSLIPESLVKWNKTLQMFGAKRTRTFRLYDRELS